MLKHSLIDFSQKLFNCNFTRKKLLKGILPFELQELGFVQISGKLMFKGIHCIHKHQKLKFSNHSRIYIGVYLQSIGRHLLNIHVYRKMISWRLDLTLCDLVNYKSFCFKITVIG